MPADGQSQSLGFVIMSLLLNIFRDFTQAQGLYRLIFWQALWTLAFLISNKSGVVVFTVASNRDLPGQDLWSFSPTMKDWGSSLWGFMQMPQHQFDIKAGQCMTYLSLRRTSSLRTTPVALFSESTVPIDFYIGNCPHQLGTRNSEHRMSFQDGNFNSGVSELAITQPRGIDYSVLCILDHDLPSQFQGGHLDKTETASVKKETRSTPSPTCMI